MPAPLLLTAQWVFLMCSDMCPSERLSDRQKANQLTSQSKHIIVKPDVTAVDAYNMMLEEYGEMCWTDMIDVDHHQNTFDINMLEQHDMLKTIGE